MLAARDYVLIFKSTFLQHFGELFLLLWLRSEAHWWCLWCMSSYCSSEFSLQTFRHLCSQGRCIRQFWLLGMYLMPFPRSLSFDIKFPSGNLYPFAMYKTFIYNIIFFFPSCLLKRNSKLQFLMKNLLPSCFIKTRVCWCLGWVQVK